MCEHISIIDPDHPEKLPRILRWRWPNYHVDTVKKMIDRVTADKILVDLIPTESELDLLPNWAQPTEALELVGEGSLQQPEEGLLQCDDTVDCSQCKEKGEKIESLKQELHKATKSLEEANKNLATVIEEKDSLVAAKDIVIADMEAMLKEKDQQISELRKERDTSGNKADTINSDVDNRILTVKDKIIADAENKIKELQQVIQSISGEPRASEGIDPASEGIDPNLPIIPTNFRVGPKRKRTQRRLISQCTKKKGKQVVLSVEPDAPAPSKTENTSSSQIETQCHEINKVKTKILKVRSRVGKLLF